MKNILVAGAGKSATALIQYLISKAETYDWTIQVLDGYAPAIAEKTKNHPRTQDIVADITNEAVRNDLVSKAAIVLSLMPAHLHRLLAQSCLQHRKHLITASYVDPEIMEMNEAVTRAGLMFLCEMGLDPGIDHMSAHKMLRSIHAAGGSVESFKSYCGGLMSPEDADNAFRYKFSWNPANIVSAGKSGAHFLKEGEEVHVPYERLFEPSELIPITGMEALGYYANRDSLSYIQSYRVPEVKTFLRATLRYPEFMTGWNSVVALHLTDDTDALPEHVNTYASWLRWKVGATGDLMQGILEKAGKVENPEVLEAQLRSIGLFEPIALPETATNSAQVLLSALLSHWEMQPGDRDLVVMKHEVVYKMEGVQKKDTATMVLTGKDREMSAMAQTVGMPMALAAEGILNGSITQLPTGVHIPDMPQIYEPVLAALADHGIDFQEESEAL